MVPTLGLLAPLVVSPKLSTDPRLERHLLNNSPEQTSWFGPATSPEQMSERTHQVRIWTGMQKIRPGTPGKPGEFPEPDKGLGGTSPDITFYDEYGEVVTDNFTNVSLEQGEFRDFYVCSDFTGVNRQPTYISVSQPQKSHWNAVCIAALQIRFASGEGAVFYGDVAKACGWPVYASAAKVTYKDSSSYEPWCFWLDWDGTGDPPLYKDEVWQVTNNHRPASVNIHIPDFMVNNLTLEAYQKDKDLICKAGARLQAHPWMPRTIPIYSPPLDYNLGSNNNYLPNTKDQPGVQWNQSDTRMIPSRLRSRDSDADGDSEPESETPTERLPLDFSLDKMTTGKSVVSSFSAETICGTENAVGPSFVNVQEGKYCDMPNRRVLPFEDNNEGEEDFKVIGPAPEIPGGADINALAMLEKPVLKNYRTVTRMQASAS